jgi:hypothetical protein
MLGFVAKRRPLFEFVGHDSGDPLEFERDSCIATRGGFGTGIWFALRDFCKGAQREP